MTELLVGGAILATIAGAVASTAFGWHNSGQPYHLPKMVGAMIPAVVSGYALADVAAIEADIASGAGLGVLGLHFALGYGIDKAVTKAKLCKQAPK